MKQLVFISIGSNLDAEKNMNLAKYHLDLIFDVTYSGIYKTPAEGFVGGDFLNRVCKFETEVDPHEIRLTFPTSTRNSLPAPQRSASTSIAR